MDEIRVGVIGAGRNTQGKHIPELQLIEGVSVVVVCNRSEESGARVAGRFDIPDVMTDWRALVERDDLDAIVIGVWPYMHAPMSIAALEAGKHVLCEARMAMNLAEARAMLEASRKTDRVAQIVPSPMMLRTHHVVKEHVEDGTFGEIREIYARGLSPQAMDPSTPIHWRQRRDLSGLNIMMMGIFYEMLARYFGHARSVMAQTAIWTRDRDDPETGGKRAVDVPETAQILAEMESGAQAVFHLSAVAAHSGPARVEAYGSKGTLVLDIGRETALAGLVGGELRELEVPPGREGGWRVEKDFAESIREGKPVELTSFEEGLRYMAFTEAVHTSAVTGRRIII